MGQRGARYEQGIKIFSIEKEKKIFNWEQDICIPQKSISR